MNQYTINQYTMNKYTMNQLTMHQHMMMHILYSSLKTARIGSAGE